MPMVSASQPARVRRYTHVGIHLPFASACGMPDAKKHVAPMHSSSSQHPASWARTPRHIPRYLHRIRIRIRISACITAPRASAVPPGAATGTQRRTRTATTATTWTAMGKKTQGGIA